MRGGQFTAHCRFPTLAPSRGMLSLMAEVYSPHKSPSKHYETSNSMSLIDRSTSPPEVPLRAGM